MIFDSNINFRTDLDSDLPIAEEFNTILSLELVYGEDNADALRRQLILQPAIQEAPALIPPVEQHLNPVLQLDQDQPPDHNLDNNSDIRDFPTHNPALDPVADP